MSFLEWTRLKALDEKPRTDSVFVQFATVLIDTARVLCSERVQENERVNKRAAKTQPYILISPNHL